jgi:hypothetical protein
VGLQVDLTDGHFLYPVAAGAAGTVTPSFQRALGQLFYADKHALSAMNPQKIPVVVGPNPPGLRINQGQAYHTATYPKTVQQLKNLFLTNGGGDTATATGPCQFSRVTVTQLSASVWKVEASVKADLAITVGTGGNAGALVDVNLVQTVAYGLSATVTVNIDVGQDGEMLTGISATTMEGSKSLASGYLHGPQSNTWTFTSHAGFRLSAAMDCAAPCSGTVTALIQSIPPPGALTSAPLERR